MYAKTLVKVAKRTRLLEGKGCYAYATRCRDCPLESLAGDSYSLSCREALEKYINTKLEPEEKLEFLIAVYN